MLIRCLLSFSTFFMMTWALQVLSLSTAYIITSLFPFVLVLQSYLLLGQTVQRLEIILMTISLGAIVIIASSFKSTDEILASKRQY